MRPLDDHSSLTQQWRRLLTIVFSKYIIDEMVVLRMMYTVSMDRYRDALMLRKPSNSLLVLLQNLTFMLSDRWPCKFHIQGPLVLQKEVLGTKSHPPEATTAHGDQTPGCRRDSKTFCWVLEGILAAEDPGGGLREARQRPAASSSAADTSMGRACMCAARAPLAMPALSMQAAIREPTSWPAHTLGPADLSAPPQQPTLL